MYADETKVMCATFSILELCEVINTDLVNISEWMRTDKLSLNGSKSEVMVIGNAKKLKKFW